MSEESTETFGIVDVIEAFTAMRHELKLQSKEGRRLVEGVEQAVQRIERLAVDGSLSPAISQAAPSGNTDGAARKLADAIAEIDEVVQRAADVANQSLEASAAGGNEKTESHAAMFERIFNQQPAWVQWAAKGLKRQLLAAIEARQQQGTDRIDATLQGLRLMDQRVRKMTESCDVQRVDVIGKAFDPNEMNALEAVAGPGAGDTEGGPAEPSGSSRRPASGEVVEQLRPAYYWNGKLLRCALVRIAR